MPDTKCEVHAAVARDLEIINEEMDRKTTKMDSLSSRVRQLEIKDAKREEQIDNILEKIEGLMDSIQTWMDFVQTCFWKALGIAGTIIFFLAGFVIWYIQSL